MAKTTKGKSRTKQVETFRHAESGRVNNPTAEMQTFAEDDPRVQPEDVRYERDTPLEEGERRARDPELDPQLVWRGKDQQDWSDLVTVAPPIYIQEKIHPKAIIDDLKRQAKKKRAPHPGPLPRERESTDGGDSTRGPGSPNPGPRATDDGGSRFGDRDPRGEADDSGSRFGDRDPRAEGDDDPQPDLFADFNGLDADPEAKTEFYAHEQHWTNRMILGDSLRVMASLAEKEQYRNSVQCIYVDPPYGIKFNSNWQVSTRSRDVKDGKLDQVSREPEQIKAFRDTWKDGIHSYLTYLRDRLTVARDLLTESGSIFVQIGDENVHRVRALMDEVFGESNFVSIITVQKTTSSTNPELSNVSDFLLWYSKRKDCVKYRQIYRKKLLGEPGADHYKLKRFMDGKIESLSRTEMSGLEEIGEGARPFTADNLQSASMGREKGEGAASWFRITVNGRAFYPSDKARWKTNEQGMNRLIKAERVIGQKNAARYIRFLDDFPLYTLNNIWNDTGGASDKIYVVETAPILVQRCMLMTTDPGDLVLDPTCGSGTTATVAEQWGRRWIMIDTSRVAMALARARLMGARYPYYLLADSQEGQRKAAELTGRAPSDAPTHGEVRHGFVYKRVPHITLKAIANNHEIDVIWDRWQAAMEPLRAEINRLLGRRVPAVATADPTQTRGPGSPNPGPRADDGGSRFTDHDRQDAAGRDSEIPTSNTGEGASDPDAPPPLEEWELPRQAPADWPSAAADKLATWWDYRIRRQREIDESIARQADQEYLYDQPYTDDARVRVAGPFTFESLSPHRVVPGDEAELWEEVAAAPDMRGPGSPNPGPRADDRGSRFGDRDPHAEGDPGRFTETVIAHLRASGVQQSSKDHRITFTSVKPWPGELIAAEGRFLEGTHGARESTADGGPGSPNPGPGQDDHGSRFGDRDPQGEADDDGSRFGDRDPQHVPAPDGDGQPRERTAAIFIGPEFGTVARGDLMRAAREANEAGFDILVACAFNFEAHASEVTKLGRLRIVRARMNPELHMSDDLKNTGTGNLFVVFGEPDIAIEDAGGDHVRVRIQGLDIFDPTKGEVRAGGTDGGHQNDIAAWFIDTDYDAESFFVRHAYFLGGHDPYKALKTALKAEIDEDAWASLHRDVSRPFPRPATGRIAVKVINHFGDEVMQVFGV